MFLCLNCVCPSFGAQVRLIWRVRPSVSSKRSLTSTKVHRALYLGAIMECSGRRVSPTFKHTKREADIQSEILHLYSCRPLVPSIWDCFDANGTFEDAFVKVKGRDRIAVASEIMPYSFSSAEMLELHTSKVTSAATYMLQELLPPGCDDAKHAEGSIRIETSEALFMSLKQRYTLHILPRRTFIVHSILVLELTRPEPDVRIARFRDVVLYRPPLLDGGKPAALRALPFMPHPLRRLAGMSAWAFFAGRHRMLGK